MLYTHIDARQITDIVKAQQALSGIAEKKPADDKPALTLVKPEKKNSQKQKPA
jgi:hypothetical protein